MEYVIEGKCFIPKEELKATYNVVEVNNMLRNLQSKMLVKACKWAIAKAKDNKGGFLHYMLNDIEDYKNNKNMRYHLNIIDGNVELPDELCGEYTDFDKAYDDLFQFVHSFDGKLQVDGRIIGQNGHDVDYSSSLKFDF